MAYTPILPELVGTLTDAYGHVRTRHPDLPESPTLALVDVVKRWAEQKKAAPAQIALPAYDPGNGSAPMALELDLGASTQYGNSFSVGLLAQDGHATGRLTGIEVSEEGVVEARYTNGVSTPLGQVAMTNFANPQGLQSLGNNSWSATHASGEPRVGYAGSSDFGMVQGGALEASNVDLTEQLVNMITAQRNFQANAQMISTQDQITQTVINIR